MSSCENEFQTLQDLYTGGNDVERINVIEALPQLFGHDHQAAFVKILEEITSDLPISPLNFHLSTSKSFTFLIEKHFPMNLLDVILKQIDSKDLAVANIWLDTLLNIISALNEEQIRNEIVPVIVMKAQSSVNNKIISCKILGKVSLYPNVKTLDIKTTILRLVQSLCQDCHQDVRAAMCSQLHFIVQGLGDNFVKSNLLPNLVELVSDEDIWVRCCAVNAVVQIIPYLSKQTKTDTILPLLKRLAERPCKNDDLTFLTIAKEFNKLLESLKKDLSVSDCVWFLKFYKTLTNCDVNIKRECALNLSAITLFTILHIITKLKLWYTIFHNLANDQNVDIRKIVAGSLHDIIRILGFQSKLIQNDIIGLLHDESDDILRMLTPKLGTILELLCTFRILSRNEASQFTVDLIDALVIAQKSLFKSYNWRIQSTFLIQLEYLPKCLPSDLIFNNFVDLVFEILHKSRPKPVKSQATKTLLVFLRHNNNEHQKILIRERLISLLCHSDSCYERQIYIKMCYYATEIFSINYFKKHFLFSLTKLADDPVSNVRLSLVEFLQYLRTINDDIKWRVDKMLTKIEGNETNKDVLEILKNKTNGVNKIKSDHDYLKTNEQKAPKLYSECFLDKTKPVPDLTNEISNTHQTCDMKFLEQHFYIDAGVTLPQETGNLFSEKLPSVPTVSVDLLGNLSENELKKLQITTTNITDDVKVSLRNLNKKNKDDESMKRAKRHSSIYPSENKHNRNNLNRRSLNLAVKDLSKIPIILKKSKSNSDVKITNQRKCFSKNKDTMKIENDTKTKEKISGDGLKRENKEIKMKSSNLPILKR